jgi:hypothetical protein
MKLWAKHLLRPRLLNSLLLVGSVIVLAAPGCQKPTGSLATVSGRVTLNGKPLPGGSVTFFVDKPGAVSPTVDIDESGNYPPVHLPPGEVKIKVDNRVLAPRPAHGGAMVLPKGLSAEVKSKMRPPRATPADPPGGAAGRYLAIPERYYMVETSDLAFTVQPGDQKHDIELKSP